MKQKPRSHFRGRRRPAQPYLPEVVALTLTAGFAPGQVRHVEVLHDDECRIFSGGVCDCRFEVREVQPR